MESKGFATDVQGPAVASVKWAAAAKDKIPSAAMGSPVWDRGVHAKLDGLCADERCTYAEIMKEETFHYCNKNGKVHEPFNHPL